MPKTVLRKPHALVLCLLLLLPLVVRAETDGMGAVDYDDHAQVVRAPSKQDSEDTRDSDETPRAKPPRTVGRKAAQKYMGQTPEGPRGPASASVSKETHYLAVHVGTFLSDDAYSWGSPHETNVGKFDVGVTYRLGEWVNSADFVFRADYESFQLTEGTANKLALIPAVIFPDASSKFPLYFGAGAGPGFYLKQIQGQSAISADYQLFLGARFFNLLETTGFFIEAGLKNHIHLLANGQYNGSFIAFGAVFTF